MTEDFDAQAALDAAHETRAHFADHVRTPWWCATSCGVLVAVLCLVLGLPRDMLGLPARPFAVLLVLCGLLATGRLYRRSTGVWIQTPSGPHGRHLLIGCAVGVVAAIWVSVANCLWSGPRWLPFLVGVVVIVGSVAFGRHYDSMWRAELRTGASG